MSTAAPPASPIPTRSQSLPCLAAAVGERTATVAVVGLGYVGLPLALAVAQAGFGVIGIDAVPDKVAALRAGRSYVSDLSDAELAPLSTARFTTDLAAAGDADVVLIAVPTPLRDGSPDLSLVEQAGAAVGRVLRPGSLVVLESTTYPGTTEELLVPLLECGGLRAGRDFAVAFSPERVDPGSTHTLRGTPKVVGGLTPSCGELAAAFYATLVDRVVVTRGPREAEMAKLIENTFRQVNIALVNELATIAPDLGVDIWAALDAAATKPFGYMPFWPGPGVGGHCIAVDPSYLSWRAEQKLGYGIGFIQHARAVNNRMPAHVVARVRDLLDEAGTALRGARIHVLGVAYKPDVNDARESPAVAVAERLLRAGADVSYTDPYLQQIELDGRMFVSVAATPDLLAGCDLVVLLTAHRGLDHDAVLDAAPRLLDATGSLRDRTDAVDAGRLVLL
ncbi:MAG TPA: nucleotide sugar dehydrogenase [Geodermatophilus sp.]|nr:nucleotide sugar dehydrogenase [Geodermatophilus sp.]